MVTALVLALAMSQHAAGQGPLPCPALEVFASPGASPVPVSTPVAFPEASPFATPGRLRCSVEIRNFTFRPAQIFIAVGTTVTWTNRDTTDHRVRSDDPEFDSLNLSPGERFSHTFRRPGDYDYRDPSFPAMDAGFIVVE